MTGQERVEVHLEELGQHSWVKAMANTLGGSFGSAQYRFVACSPGREHHASDHVVTGATFPVMRFQDLNNLTVPNAWIETAQDRLQELDQELLGRGWRRESDSGEHWWSLTYIRSGVTDAPQRLVADLAKPRVPGDPPPMRHTTEASARQHMSPDLWPGVAISLGAGTGAAVGVVVAGGPGVAVGVALGAGLGVVVGAIVQARRNDPAQPGQGRRTAGPHGGVVDS